MQRGPAHRAHVFRTEAHVGAHQRQVQVLQRSLQRGQCGGEVAHAELDEVDDHVREAPQRHWGTEEDGERERRGGGHRESQAGDAGEPGGAVRRRDARAVGHVRVDGLDAWELHQR